LLGFGWKGKFSFVTMREMEMSLNLIGGNERLPELFAQSAVEGTSKK